MSRTAFGAASPSGVPRAQVELSWKAVSDAWDGAATPFLPLTLDGLSQIAANNPRVVHLLAHGQADGLVLADDQNKRVPAAGDAVATRLAAAPDLAVVVLAACDSADLADRLVAHTAARAVIATTAPVADSANRIFSGALHRALARGASVQAAFDAGRQALEARQASYHPLLVGDGDLVVAPQAAEPRALTLAEERELVDLALTLELGPRDVLLQYLPPLFRATMKRHSNLLAQTMADVNHLNRHRRVRGLDGPPLACWLYAAEQLAGFLPEADRLTELRQIVGGDCGASPR